MPHSSATPQPLAPPDPAPPAADAAAGGRPLAVVRLDLPACDPLAFAATVPSGRRLTLWRAPGGATLVGVGRAVAATGHDVAALGPALAGALAARLAPGVAGAAPLTALLAVAFDPERSGASEAEADHPSEDADRWPDWRRFAPAELMVPEVLVRFPAPGERRGARAPAPRATVVAAGGAEGLATAAAEAAGWAAAAGTAAPRLERRDLAIEWAGGRHREDVASALEALRTRDLRKVVLAHAVTVRRDRPFAPARLLAELADGQPEAFLFLVRPAAAEGSAAAPAFLGASPERLARLDGRRLVSGALAGTAPRGATPAEDAEEGRRLLASAKDREEHAIVADTIAAALTPLAERVAWEPEPRLERLPNVQHLFTPVEADLAPGATLLDAVAALHPTPAVGGTPREAAIAAIRRLERSPRGLYAGVVGYVGLVPEDGTGGTDGWRLGDGDSAVAIRSALVDGARAAVYAGGGIVPGSDPDAEVAETRLKLAAVLEAMRSPADAPDAAAGER